jgi:RNA polymerase sigma factor (sigma-70 family)
MTEDQIPSTGPDDVEHREYAAFVDSLTGALDLCGGLGEALNVADYTTISSDIANLLDLEAGLQSALAAHHHGTEPPREIGATTRVTDLLLRAVDGDPAAWDEIVRRYSGVVSATVSSFRLQDADAEDAVQMTWLRLAENCHRIQRPEHLSGWLATTARRECLHILRHQAELPQLTPYDTVDSLTDPEQIIIDADIARALGELFEELPPRRRTLLQALFSDTPRPYAEVARAAGIPPGGIGPTRARALRQLRDRLAEQGLSPAARDPKTSESDLPVSPNVPKSSGQLMTRGSYAKGTRIRIEGGDDEDLATQWRALGPIEVVVGGRLADLGPPRQRALFGLLLSRVDHPVAVDAVIEELWSGDPPPGAMTSVRAYVSNLRRVLEPDRPPRAAATVLRTRSPGYLLDSRGVDFDVHLFAEYTASGRAALDREDSAQAFRDFEAALGLWRGRAYADVCDAAWAAPEVARLEELRLSVVEARCEAQLLLGDHHGVVAELEIHVRTLPLREHSCELLALALYRAGRQAEAVGVLRVTRTRLAEELGIDPSAALQRLEQDILTQSPTLDWHWTR